MDSFDRFGHFYRCPGRRRAIAFMVACGLVLAAAGLGAEALADQQASFKIIVNPANSTRGETREFLEDAFLKNIVDWPNGEGIKPVDQRRDADVRHDFSKRVLKRSVAAVRNYWQQRIFSGRGVPPPELGSDQAVVEYVLKHPGAVGYISKAADPGKARVVHVK